jgi:tetratricopeptide (TPR) repeat protein
MPAVELAGEAVRRQIDDVLKSPGFARNERLSRFLRFIVERHLEGRYEELKESVIGVEVFGRQPDYDTKLDPIVRTEARRLRLRLGEYFKGAGADAVVVIDLPKGGYVPVVRLSAQAPPVSASALESTPPPPRRRHLALLAFGAAVVFLAAVGLTGLGAPGHPRPASNPAAYDLYLRARASEMQRGASGVEPGIELFEQAIAKDPSFAPAYAGLAAMEASRSAFDRFLPSERADMIAKGWAAAEKALQLDPRLADAHDALAMMQARQAQWEPAERSFRRAIELAPRDPLWRDHFAGYLLLPLGRIQEAIDQFRSAVVLDPGFLSPHFGLDQALRAIGKFDDAEFHCRKAAENNQEMSRCWAQTFVRQGKTDDAVRVLEAAWTGNLLRMGARNLGVVYAQAGRREDAERIAAMAPRSGSKALIFAALGDKDRTLEMLNEMLPTGPTRIGRELIAPEYAFLRGDPRLKAIRKKVGLPE